MTETLSLRIVQISDMHLFADETEALLGVNTRESFAAVIDLLKSDSVPPQIILLSGDLSQDRTEASYRYLADALKIFSVPVYCIPGNHDDKNTMKKVYPNPVISDLKHILLERWQVILLDSQKPHAVEGYLDQMQLDFMQECLNSYPSHHAVIVFHHPPISVGSEWLDQLGLVNAKKFWQIAMSYSNVHTVLFGHVHQQYEGKIGHISYYSVPSTCIQFKRNSKNFALEKLSPGYRWIDLYSDGELKTGVRRTNHYVGVFDVNAKGY